MASYTTASSGIYQVKKLPRTVVPGLVFMRSPAGCGKSTVAYDVASRWQDPAAVISTDAIRRELSGDEDNQDLNDLVFVQRDARILHRLATQQPAVCDSTNLTLRGLEPLIEAAHANDLPVMVLDCTQSMDTALARNAARDRVVPTHVIQEQYDLYRENPPTVFVDVGVDVYWQLVT